MNHKSEPPQISAQNSEVPHIQKDPTDTMNGQAPTQSSIPQANAEGLDDLTFAAAVKQLRQGNGLTQKQLATNMGHMSAEWSTMLETGHRRIDLSELPQLARILQVDPRDLAVLALRQYFPAVAGVLFPGAEEPRLPRPEDKSVPDQLLPASLAIAKSWEQLAPRQRNVVREMIAVLRESANPSISGHRRVNMKGEDGPKSQLGNITGKSGSQAHPRGPGCTADRSPSPKTKLAGGFPEQETQWTHIGRRPEEDLVDSKEALGETRAPSTAAAAPSTGVARLNFAPKPADEAPAK